MSLFRKSAAAVMIASAGLAATSGLAFADDSDSIVISDSGKLVDTSDSNTLSGNAILCDIEAGQLVSIEDAAAQIPVEFLTQKRDSPESNVAGQSTCNPTSSNKSVSATDNSAG